ncbi:hypothetical protein [Variovorax sp. HJSM1_2]|uniref:hypothetical protein n=1 Tax=Variovorax sp. HJSM1_2 TaxID=3366263 RepID=UPI003BD81612
MIGQVFIDLADGVAGDEIKFFGRIGFCEGAEFAEDYPEEGGREGQYQHGAQTKEPVLELENHSLGNQFFHQAAIAPNLKQF